ncbi:hypothetical protein ABZ490_38665 [Streptomyces sp. NPDC005811]|uniref:hypothetical protein n=1 Tax=Streptomyces sp. NPDC005811 TaxID=3154565 RepID=UPI00340D7C4C
MSDTTGLPGTQTVTRLSVNINKETKEALERLKAKNLSITEVVRRAITLYDLVDRETADGGRLQIVDNTGRVRELMLLP